MKKTTTSILKYLNNKKSSIVGVLSLTIAFLLKKEVIDIDTSLYLSELLAAIAFGANYATNKLVK